VHLLVAAPDAGKQVIQAGHIQHRQADDDGEPED
jgi:hypothetical protein